MERRMIVASLICGLLCAACLFGYVMLVQRQAEAEKLQVMEEYGGEQVDVLVATKDIYPGETLDSTNVKQELWVSGLLPEGAVTKTEDGWGKKVTSLVLSGEVISSKRFEGESDTVEIPDGYVAVSVPAKDVQAVGGSIASGDKVDVYAVGTTTSRIGESVLVLATSASTTDESSQTEVEWVTLAVLPESAQEYIAASEDLDIYFALPSSGDATASALDDDGATDSGDGASEGDNEKDAKSASSEGDANGLSKVKAGDDAAKAEKSDEADDAKSTKSDTVVTSSDKDAKKEASSSSTSAKDGESSKKAKSAKKAESSTKKEKKS